LLIYPSGRFIVVKNYLNPSECFVYRGHTAQTTVAKFSPNGFWVASADITGKVRVWSWDNPEHLTKLETPVFSGPVLDVDWDYESKKIVAVGDGSGLLAKCFTWDTGNAAGEMHGHNKRVSAVSYKPTRPFRIFSGGEDMRCCFYQGPPFKLDHSNTNHTNFVNAVRYAANGSKVVSVGGDKRITVCDGTSGQPLHEIANAHDGGIYAVVFNPTSTQFATASADKTVKIWNAETYACEQTIALSATPQIGDAQVALVWTREQLMSLSLNGDLNILSTSGSTGPEKMIQNHQTSISAFYLDKTHDNVLYTASSDGVVCYRSLSATSADSLQSTKVLSADKKAIAGNAHTGKVTGLVVSGESLYSVGWDDKLRTANISNHAYHSDQALNGQPVCMIRNNSSDLVVIVTTNEVAFYRNGEKLSATAVSTLGYSPQSAALLGEEELALGGSDFKTHIYNIAGLSLTEVTTVETRSAVTSLAYNPTGDLLAIGDAGRQVEVYERGSWTAKVKGKWVYHTSKITSLSWSPSGNYLASGSVDESIIIWNLNSPLQKLQLSFTHVGGVTGIDWLGEDRLASGGQDGTVVLWKLPATIA
jgi:WD repeat-containing protein 1 (actin-interacting protein 1)